MARLIRLMAASLARGTYIPPQAFDKGDNLYLDLGQLKQEIPCVVRICAILSRIIGMCDSETMESPSEI